MHNFRDESLPRSLSWMVWVRFLLANKNIQVCLVGISLLLYYYWIPIYYSSGPSLEFDGHLFCLLLTFTAGILLWTGTKENLEILKFFRRGKHVWAKMIEKHVARSYIPEDDSKRIFVYDVTFAYKDRGKVKKTHVETEGPKKFDDGELHSLLLNPDDPKEARSMEELSKDLEITPDGELKVVWPLTVMASMIIPLLSIGISFYSVYSVQKDFRYLHNSEEDLSRWGRKYLQSQGAEKKMAKEKVKIIFKALRKKGIEDPDYPHLKDTLKKLALSQTGKMQGEAIHLIALLARDHKKHTQWAVTTLTEPPLIYADSKKLRKRISRAFKTMGIVPGVKLRDNFKMMTAQQAKNTLEANSNQFEKDQKGESPGLKAISDIRGQKYIIRILKNVSTRNPKIDDLFPFLIEKLMTVEKKEIEKYISQFLTQVISHQPEMKSKVLDLLWPYLQAQSPSQKKRARRHYAKFTKTEESTSREDFHWIR